MAVGEGQFDFAAGQGEDGLALQDDVACGQAAHGAVGVAGEGEAGYGNDGCGSLGGSGAHDCAFLVKLISGPQWGRENYFQE